MAVADTIREALSRALVDAGVQMLPAQVPLEFPAELAHGDYATGIALAKAKEVGLAPRALAEKIVASMGGIEGVTKIDIAGPGFINFRLSPKALAETVETIRATDMWGANNTLKNEQVLLEYTSPNLFKPLHVGNLVGTVLGESLARLMQFAGADVKRLNYPSDIGLMVAKGVWGLKKTSGDPRDIAALGEAYRAGNEGDENDANAKKEIEDINKKLYERSDAELNALRDAGVSTSRAHLDMLCEQLGTKFDHEIYESEAAPVGRDIVAAHPDLFPESEGARVFHGAHTRVFLNSHGLPTYEAKDLGNFILKQQKYPHWNSYLIVTGVEQKEYFGVLFEAIRKLFPETAEKNLRHIATGFLTLTTGKMSSRKGNVLTGESLLADLKDSANERAAESRADDKEKLAEHVAVAAIKYEILKQGSGKNIVFDKERALSLEGDSGPYLQYTHARTAAIGAKAQQQGVAAECRTSDVLHGYEVVRLLPRFPDIVERATKEYEPHLVTSYLLQLAAAFNSWYAQEQILDGTLAAAHKVALTDAVRRTLKNGLWLLGIPAPEKM